MRPRWTANQKSSILNLNSFDNSQILYVNLMVKVIDVIFELDVTGFS